MELYGFIGMVALFGIVVYIAFVMSDSHIRGNDS